MMKFRILLCIVLASALCSFTFFAEDNKIPVVKISEPLNGKAIIRGTVVRYKIDVEDKEDGNTAYEEITPAEVVLKIKYLPSAKNVAAYIQKEKPFDKTFLIMRQNNCLNCHAVQQKLTGPSFRDIAKKYGATAATYERLSKKIMKGSAGVWSDGQQMPAHPKIKKETAVSLAKLVIHYGLDKTFDLYTGTEGIINISKSKSSSVLLLMASYLDHGIETKNRKEGKGMMRVNLK